MGQVKIKGPAEKKSKAREVIDDLKGLGEAMARIQDDDFKIIVDKRHKFTGSEDLLSINGKQGRIVIYGQTFDRTIKRYGKEFKFVQLLTRPSRPGYFWIRPCTRQDIGSRAVHFLAGSRSISAKLLLQELKWTSEKAVHFQSKWDEAAGAIMVNINKPED